MENLTMESHSVEETMQLACQFGKILKKGDCVTLEGDLGAGKTHFAKGIAKALNIKAMVTSPTYTIIKEYEGTTPLYHMDVYRAEGQADDLGLEEYFYGNGITVIEWAHLIEDLLPKERFVCSIKKTDDHFRQISIKAIGNKQGERLRELK